MVEPAYKRWYKTQRWVRLRAKQLRDHPLCAFCTREQRVTAASVCDHVNPHRGNEALFWSGPFQSLCKPHHDSDKARIENGRAPIAAIDRDGWPQT